MRSAGDTPPVGVSPAPLVIDFSVHGLPAAQGSKTPWGAEANPRLHPWRNDIQLAALAEMNGTKPLAGPVSVAARFTFPRPKSHFGTGRNEALLKDSAPIWVAKAPDLDKLMRALGDALSGIVIRDDAQIAQQTLSKCYGPNPGVDVIVIELKGAP
jgi:Holliday junction resolvase RusA-like endonuclease